MMRTSLIPAAAIAVLGACSSAEDSVWPEPRGENPQNVVTTELLNTGVFATVPAGNAAKALPAMVKAILEEWGVPANAACVRMLARGTDFDRDGIPMAGKIYIDCTEAPAGAVFTTTIDGVIRVFDRNDRVAGDGFRLFIETLKFHTYVRERETNASALQGEVAVMVRGTPPTLGRGFDFKEKLQSYHQRRYEDGAARASSEAFSVAGNYLPDGKVARIDPLALGQFRFDGTKETVADGTTTRLTFRTEPTLHWNRSCLLASADASGFDDGAVVYYDDAGMEKQRIEFYGCTAWESYPPN